MRRKEILTGVRQVIEAINKSEVFDVFLKIVQASETDKNRLQMSLNALEALRVYTLEAAKFNDAGKVVNEVLELNRLTSAVTWQKIAVGRQTVALHKLFQTINFAKDYLPPIVKLLQQETFEDGGNDNTTTKFKGMRVLTVNIFEAENVTSSPIRLANVLESINHFYTACALMSGLSPSTLSVISCDSGSDKSFDFLGIASVMDCIERLIKTLFERVFFYREIQFEERLDLVAKALPIIQQIEKMEEHKEIDPEMAHILKRNVFDGTNKFLQSGATIGAIEDKSEYDSRALLSPIQKLLVPASLDEKEQASPVLASLTVKQEPVSNSEQITEQSDGNGLDFKNLTEEERKQLIKLIVKSRNTPSETADTSAYEQDDEDEYPNSESHA